MFADDRAPYVSDALQDLIDRYHVDDFSVKQGRNIFAGRNVSNDEARNFEEKYCSDLKLIEIVKTDAVDMETGARFVDTDETEYTVSRIKNKQGMVCVYAESDKVSGWFMRDSYNVIMPKEQAGCIDEQDFADAVAGIPVNDGTLEQ